MTLYSIKELFKIESTKDLESFKDKEHFSILVYKTSSTYVPGDERSRTNPGHGYPGGYETTNDIYHYVTTSEKVLNEAILKLVEEKSDFIFFKVNRLGSFKLNTILDSKL